MSDPYSVTVSLAFLAPMIAMAFIGIILSIGLIGYILRKDPTIRWRAQRKSWGYDVWVSPSNDIKLLPVMEEDVDPTTKTFDYVPSDAVGYTHLIDDKEAKKDSVKKDEDGTLTFTHKEQSSEKKETGEIINTQFTHKGHPAWIHSWDQVMPHGFVKNSLEARQMPEAVYRTKDGNIRKQIDSIRVTDPLPKRDVLVIAIVMMVLIVGALSYFQSSAIASFLQSHFANPTNSTATPQCRPGYTANNLGQCVPNGYISSLPFFGLVSIIRPNIAFSPKTWRKYTGVNKTKSWILSILSFTFIPSLALYFAISKFYVVYEGTGGQGDFDYSVVATFILVIFSLTVWYGGAFIGDRIFLFRNKWAKYYDISLDEARKIYFMNQLQQTSDFWNMCDKIAHLDIWLGNWIMFYISRSTTPMYIED